MSDPNGTNDQEMTAEKLLEQARVVLGEIQALKQQAETAVASAQKSSTDAETTKTAAETAKDAAVVAKDEAVNQMEAGKLAQAKTKAIADTAAEADTRVTEYEGQLSKMLTDYDGTITTSIEDGEKKTNELHGKIESLLPGATSASLASAFETRKGEVGNRKAWWMTLQILGTVAFIGFGFWSFIQPEVTGFKELVLLVLKRTPILAGLVFLIDIGRRRYGIAYRLEEDYGYKEVLSRSFDGYRKQMTDVGEPQIQKLSMDLLVHLSQEPGRLIDKEKASTRGMREIPKMEPEPENTPPVA